MAARSVLVRVVTVDVLMSPMVARLSSLPPFWSLTSLPIDVLLVVSVAVVTVSSFLCRCLEFRDFILEIFLALLILCAVIIVDAPHLFRLNRIRVCTASGFGLRLRSGSDVF